MLTLLLFIINSSSLLNRATWKQEKAQKELEKVRMVFNNSSIKNAALAIALTGLAACGGGSSSSGGSAELEKRVDECIQEKDVISQAGDFQLKTTELTNICDFAINVGVRKTLGSEVTDIYSLAPGQTAAETIIFTETAFACRAPSLPISSGRFLSEPIEDNCT
jgi:hypothetical protein